MSLGNISPYRKGEKYRVFLGSLSLYQKRLILYCSSSYSDIEVALTALDRKMSLARWPQYAPDYHAAPG